jgi:hypothetical protein
MKKTKKENPLAAQFHVIEFGVATKITLGGHGKKIERGAFPRNPYSPTEKL